MDPRAKAFIDAHSDNVRSVFDEVTDYVGMSLEERGKWVSRALGDLDPFLDWQPGRREAVPRDHRRAKPCGAG